NVLVGDDGVARVADFGLARPTDAGVRQVAGTPAYMSPEQFLGEPVDARSDVFAFCVALYEALYAEAPYAGDTYEELRANVTAQALRPAPARSVGPAPLRAAIVRGLARDPEARYPSMTALLDALVAFTPRPSRWPARIAWLAVVGGVALGVAWLVGQRPGPTPAEVAALAGDAALAGRSASAAEWVYPAEEGSAAATSIRRIVDLERVEGPAGALARGAAARLRERFAADLARLGAHYWETPQTRPFGRDFYAQTLIFRPDHEEALKRGNFTIGQLAQLRAQAEASGFTPEELAAVAPLRILANTDDPELAAKLAALLNSCDGPLTQTGGGIAAATRGGAASSAAADPRLATQAEEPAAEAEPEVEPPAEPEPAPEAGPAPEAEPAPEPEAPAKARPRGPSPASIIAQAESARRRGQDGEAMALFGQALALAPGNSTALAALSDIAFDRGDFKEAVRLARQAIKASPKIAEHHTRLGDALFKLGRRSDARAAFVRALELGDGRAQRRIDLLDQEQGAAR
ncbi:MAG: tetratricopeptide repeat protein, partial [Nannocystaceae bacterium]